MLNCTWKATVRCDCTKDGRMQQCDSTATYETLASDITPARWASFQLAAQVYFEATLNWRLVGGWWKCKECRCHGRKRNPTTE